MERVANILEADPNPRLGVVLSACRGITDALLNLVTFAERQDDSVPQKIEEIYKRHDTIATALLPSNLREEFLAGLRADCNDIT